MSKDDRGTGRFTAYKEALTSHGVPVNLAGEAAEVLERETNSWESGTPYQRSEEEQHIVRSAHSWMLAGGGNHETK